MKYNKIITLVTILSLYSNIIFGQVSNWGAVSLNEKNYKECAFEKEADAVILYESGYYELNENDEYATLQVHVRIKILSQEAITKKRADIAIPYYAKDGFETIVNIVGHTLNSDQQEGIQIFEIGKSQIFEVKKDKYFKEMRFTFPNVQVGSILEYRYKLSTKRISYPPSWYFQSNIPSLYSEYKTKTASKLLYNILYRGERITKEYADFKESPQHWVLKNINSYKIEPFSPNVLDFIEQIQFRLAGYLEQGGGSSGYGGVNNTYLRPLSISFEKIGENYLNDDDVNKIISRKQLIKNELNKVNISKDSPLETAQNIYEYVKNNYVWNEQYDIYPDQTLNELVNKKIGNSSEINLFLTMLLQEANLEASSILISTKSHGSVVKDYYSLSQFNHVISRVVVKEKEYFLNACDKLRPFGLLAKDDLNWTGLLLKQRKFRWIDIPLPTQNYEFLFIETDFNSNPTHHKINAKFNDYDALNERMQLISKNNEDYFKNHRLVKSISISEVQNTQVSAKDSINKPLLLNIEGIGQPIEDAEILYLPLFNQFESNPFKLEKRTMPIDLVHPFKKSYTHKIVIPEGYIIEELPENISLSLLNKKALFIFSAIQVGNFININSKFSLDVFGFSVEEYPLLRDFFGRIIAKQSEQIVLKKKK